MGNILITSDFPDILSKGVEYTIPIQIFSQNQIDCKISYKFSESTCVRRMNKQTEMRSILNEDLLLTFTIDSIGLCSFYLYIDDELVYEKEFFVENILPIEYTECCSDDIIEVVCIQKPKDGIFYKSDNILYFTQQSICDLNYQKYTEQDDIFYCGVRYIAPIGATHWRVKTSTLDDVTDSGYNECSFSNTVDWFFPIAKKRQNNAYTLLNQSYTQSIGFYILVGNEYVELCYNDFIINIISEEKNQTLVNTIWSTEILKLISYIKEGYQAKDLIRKYGVWHSLSDEEIRHDITMYKDDFGEFALNKGLIETKNQAILLNYATHYTLIDSIIKLGITDLKQTRDEFQELMLFANKGVSTVLSQIK